MCSSPKSGCLSLLDELSVKNLSRLAQNKVIIQRAGDPRSQNMKLLSVSDLQRTTDGVKEQQLNQTCFGNLVAPKCSRGAEGELAVVLLCQGKGLLGVSVSPGQNQVVHEGEGRALHETEIFRMAKTTIHGRVLLPYTASRGFWGTNRFPCPRQGIRARNPLQFLPTQTIPQ